jgi:hypothetical protein
MPFDPLTYLIVLAISVGVAYLTQKKIKGPKPAKFNEIEMPTVEQGTPYPIIFGTPPRISGQMVLWYGDYATKKVKVSSGIFGGKTTIGYQYYMGVHIGISHASIDGVIQLWAEDTCVWPQVNDDTQFATDGVTEIDIVGAGAIWGGRKSGGGVNGYIDILYGASSQDYNEYLVSQLTSDIPAFIGITSLVFKRTYWGTSKRFPIMSFVLKRNVTSHDGTAIWYPAKAVINTYDLNPIHVLYELCTSSIFGGGLDTSKVNDANFRTAADTIYTEGLGVSFRYAPGEESAVELVKILEQVIDGFLYEDHSTGELKSS